MQLSSQSSTNRFCDSVCKIAHFVILKRSTSPFINYVQNGLEEKITLPKVILPETFSIQIQTLSPFGLPFSAKGGCIFRQNKPVKIFRS